MSRSRMKRHAAPAAVPPGAAKRVKISKGPARATDYDRAIRDVVVRAGFAVRPGDDGYYGAPVDSAATDHVKGRNGERPCHLIVPDTAVVSETHSNRFHGTFTSDTVQSVLTLPGVRCSCGRWKGAWRYEASMAEVIRRVSTA